MHFYIIICIVYVGTLIFYWSYSILCSTKKTILTEYVEILYYTQMQSDFLLKIKFIMILF